MGKKNRYRRLGVSVLGDHFIVPVVIKRSGRGDVIKCIDVSVIWDHFIVPVVIKRTGREDQMDRCIDGYMDK